MTNTQVAIRNAQRHNQLVVHILNISIRDRNAADKLSHIFRRRNRSRSRDYRIVINRIYS